MRYRLSCDGRHLADVSDPEIAQLVARAHAGTMDRLDWQYDPAVPRVTIAECEGRIYRLDLIPIEERRSL